MKKKFRINLVSLLCILAIAISIIIPSNTVYAKSIAGIIQKFSINDINGAPLEHPIDQFENFSINAVFKLPDAKIEKGDTTVLKLPDMINVNSQDIALMDRENIIANAVVNWQTKEIKITYTEYAASKSGITGNFSFIARLNPEVIKDTGKYEVIIEEEGKPISAGDINYKIPSKVSPHLAKSGSKGGKNVGAYLIAINRSGRGFKDAQIVDRMVSEGITIRPGTFQVEKGVHTWTGNGWKLEKEGGGPAEIVTNQFKFEMDSDNRGFKVNMGDIEPGVGYYIRYTADVSYDPDNKEIFYNDIKIDENGENIAKSTGKFTYVFGDGEASGYSYSASLLKTDDFGNPLAGAQFKIVRDSTGKEVTLATTDSEGKIVFKDLLKTEYTIIETKAPEGYQLSTKEYHIKAEDFDENKHVDIGKIKNNKTMDYDVKKTWDDKNDQDGKRPTEIQVELYKSVDGKDTLVDTKEVTGTGDTWDFKFENLPIAEDGKEITYSIKEVQVPGYTTSIEGNTITNTYKPEKPVDPEKPTIPYWLLWSYDEPTKSLPKLNTDDHYAYMIGYPKGVFMPNGNITRAESVTIFFRLLTESSRNKYWSTNNDFKDVKSTDWYNNGLSTMKNAGVIKADENGNYRPNEAMTRADFAVILTKFFDEKGAESHIFSDIAGHYAEAEIARVTAKGWIDGYPDGTFKPDAHITRAEAAKLVNRILARTPHRDGLLEHMIKFPDNADKGEWYYAEVQEAINSHEYERIDSKSYEKWTILLPVRDWAALEKEWSNANSSKNPGEVIK